MHGDKKNLGPGSADEQHQGHCEREGCKVDTGGWLLFIIEQKFIIHCIQTSYTQKKRTRRNITKTTSFMNISKETVMQNNS